MSPVLPTSERAAEYAWFGRQCLDYARRTGRSGVKAIADGAVTVLCRFDRDKAILIVLAGNFATHPRTGYKLAQIPYYDAKMNECYLPAVYGGGWAQKTDGTWRELDTRWIFPLADDDQGTFALDTDEDEGTVTAEWAGSDDENYGNLYWIGEGEEPDVLSWRGPPSVQFPVDAGYNIPGLSQSDGASGYTVYGGNIYRNGSILCAGPCGLVVGACYTSNQTGQRYLMAIVHVKVDTGYQMQVYRSEYGEKWEYLSGFPVSGLPTTPAFISQSGKSFVYHKMLYTISSAIDLVIATQSVSPATSVTRSVSGKGGYGSNYTFSGTQYSFPGLSVDDKPAIVESQLNAIFTSTGSGSPDPEITDIKIPVYRGNPSTSVVVTIADNNPPCDVAGSGTSIVFVATPHDADGAVGGSFCDVVWSGVDCYKGRMAVKKFSGCTGGEYTVTCTLEPQGVSGSYSGNVAPTAVSISGPGAPSDGDGYLMIGATGDVTWSISKGSITHEGVVTVSGQCGTATITATDAVGCSASKDIRLPSGTWTPGKNVQLIIPDWGTCKHNGGSEYKCNIADPCGGYFPGHWDNINALLAAATASGATSFDYQRYSNTTVGPNYCDPTCYAVVGTVICKKTYRWQCA